MYFIYDADEIVHMPVCRSCALYV